MGSRYHVDQLSITLIESSSTLKLKWQIAVSLLWVNLGWKLSIGKIPWSCIKGRLGLQSSAALLSLYGSRPTPDCHWNYLWRWKHALLCLFWLIQSVQKLWKESLHLRAAASSPLSTLPGASTLKCVLGAVWFYCWEQGKRRVFIFLTHVTGAVTAFAVKITCIDRWSLPMRISDMVCLAFLRGLDKNGLLSVCVCVGGGGVCTRMRVQTENRGQC